MARRFLSLALALTLTLLVGCDSMHPNARMGPESARYIGGQYRRTFVAEATAEAPGAPDPTGMTARSDLTLEKPVGRRSSTGGAPRAAVIPPRNAPAAVADATTTTHGAASKASRTMSAGGIAPPAASTRTPSAALNTSLAPATTAAESSDRMARRFLRLKIHGMDESDPEAPFRVREMLSSADGVKEVVLSSKTQTAIVVVDASTDADTVRAALEAPYRAELMP